MSSLPIAQKVVSDKPPKNSVASPVSKADLEVDVDRKMRLYGVIQAFRKGRMPDNVQIDETLIYVRDHSPIETEQLSTDGKQLVHDFQDLIEIMRLFVAEKNSDEVMQQFLFHTSSAQLKGKKPSIDASASGSKANKDGKEALEHLRTLFKLLITNDETRKLFTDAKLIGRGIFADAASNVAGRARPTEEQLRGVDESAAPPERSQPEGSGSEPSTADSAFPSSQFNMPQSQVQEVPRTSKATNGSTPANGTADSTKKNFKSRFQSFSGRVPQKHKEGTKASIADGKKYLQAQFPKERRDQFINRLKKVVVECQADPQYQSSLSWFFSQLEKYFSHGKGVGSRSAGHTSSSFFSDPTLNQATTEMRTLLERCANGQSMDKMFNAADKMRQDAENDAELREWWHRVDAFVRKSLFEAGFIVKPEFETQARELQNDSKKFFDAKYKSHYDALVNSVQSWFGAWTDDPLNNSLGGATNKLFKDLLFDSEGELTFKPHLLTDIRSVILPTFIEKIGYVPIPRVEYTDKAYDVVIENLTLQGRNFFPSIIELEVNNYVKTSPYKEIHDMHHHKVNLTLSQIQADMRDVAFYFRMKNGLKLSDSGLADIFLGGKGITIKIQLSSNTKDREGGSLFKVKSVKVSVDALKIAVRESKHDFLYRVVSTFATGPIKKAISKAISDAVRSGLESADGKLVDIRDQMAAADASEDKTETKTKVLQNVWSNRKKKDSTQTEKPNKRDSQFRFVPSRDEMLLPEQGHKSGWTQKQFERDAAASEGEGWKSRAFSIVPRTV